MAVTDYDPDHPPNPPAHGQGHYRPDAHTPDDDLEDELLEWVGHAAIHHAARTTEVVSVGVDLRNDRIDLVLRNGRTVHITAKAAPAKKATKKATKKASA